MDAIQEFKFQATNYSAAFGRASGGQINIASRSGTNEYHGSVWEFLRNDKLDARTFFDRQRPPYKQNQFGAALGGPILRDKLFFFASYEGFRSRRGISRAATVPTVRMRNGDFGEIAQQIANPLDVDPSTSQRRPFPGNQIPQSLWSPISVRALQRLYPLPNGPGISNNLIAARSEIIDTDQGTIRTDYRPNTSDSFFFRYTKVRVDRDFPWVFSALPNVSSVWNAPAQNGVIGYTRLFGPRTVNEFKFGANRHTQVLEDVEQRVPVNQQLGIGGLTTDPRFQGNPTISMPGFSVTGAISNAPNNRTDNQFVWLDNLSHITGSHNLSMGVLVQRNQQNGAANSNAHGNFSFNGAFTGYPVADLLLGFPISAARCCVRGDGFRNYRKTDYGVYFQDDWKTTPNLTLNLGIRWEYFQPPFEVTDRLSMPDLTAVPATRILLAGRDGHSRSLRTSVDRNDWGPRFGFAYTLGPGRKTVVRGGYGIFFNATNLVYAFRMSGNPPFVDQESFLSSAATPQLSLSNPFPSGLGIPSLVYSGIERGLRDPYNQNWNLSLQRELGFGTVVSAAYIGNKGVKLVSVENANAPEIGAGAIGPRRPIPGLSNFTLQGSRGKSIYHALELKAERRFSRDLSFLSSFVWAKCIDAPGNAINGDGSPAGIRDPRNTRLNRGLCQADIRKRFVANFLYALPFGRNLKGAAGILSGWQLASIFNFEDGQPFSVMVPNDASNTGRFTDTADVVPGQNPNDGPRTPTRWFNTAAFRATTPLTHGTGGRNIVIGPGVARVDFSVHKDFRLAERHTLEFRGEFFNLFNRANFFQPGNAFGTASFGVISGAFDGRDVQFSLKYSF
ncbi:MAG: TonB-dependent receptor [Acidobacteria bacterium]|nr:TonB-dependent receptor [Acidobacteriota bacterium]